MTEPWLPDTCLTSQRAAQPIARIASAWATEWFKHDAWQVLGGWDEISSQSSDDFALLRRAGSMEIKGRPGTLPILALAILGKSAEEANTEHDSELLRGVGAKAIEDLEKRLSQSYPEHRKPIAGKVSAAFPRVFSILIGAVGQAQIAIECALTDLVLMARGTYSPSRIDAPLTDRIKASEDVPVSVSALLGTATISLKELADLEAGDVLLLDEKPSQFAKLLIEDNSTALFCTISEIGDSCILEFQQNQ